MNYLTTQFVADQLCLTPSRVRQLCREGLAPGAQRHGRDWLIPAADLPALRRRPPLGRPKKSGKKSA